MDDPAPSPASAPPVWRIAWWSIAVLMVLAPPVALVSFMFVSLVTSSFEPHGNTIVAVTGLLVVVLVTLGVVVLFARRGVRLGWPNENGRLVRWTLAAIMVVCGGGMLLSGAADRRRRSQEKAILGNLRHLAAAEHQWLDEFPDRLFIRYDDLVGPERSVRALQAIDGEDYRLLFPHHAGATLRVLWPKHHPVVWAAADDEAGTANGIHVTPLPGGGTCETTWLNGEMHGPFRAYTKERRLRAEATYHHGRLVGPAWQIDANGRRTDALTAP